MNEQTPPNRVALTERLIKLESKIAHMQELWVMREQMTTQALAELQAHNRIQDQESEKQADGLGRKIEQIQCTLWSGLKWLGGLLATTLLSIMLKTLGLV